jgi:hypothetical protein
MFTTLTSLFQVNFAVLQTALETRDAARATVEALHSQEQQLKRIGGQYEQVSGDFYMLRC